MFKVYTLHSTLIFPRQFKFAVLVQHTIKILHAVRAIFYLMITTSLGIYNSHDFTENHFQWTVRCSN